MATHQSRASALTYGALVGAPFGFLLQKAGVLDPAVIHKQLQLEDWRMMKTFLSAVTTGLASVTVLHTSGEITAQARPFYPIATLSGGALIGFGMHLCGACPGTLLGQVVERRAGVGWIAAGALAGACAFGYAQPFIVQHTNVYFAGSAVTFPEHFGFEMWQLAIPVLGILGAVLYVLEAYAPSLPSSEPDADAKTDAVSKLRAWLRAPRWHPYVCGGLLGLLQVPALVLAHASIGTSTAYVTVAAELRRLVDASPNHYFSKHLASSAKMAFKLALDVGLMAGALCGFLSSAQRTGAQAQATANKGDGENASEEEGEGEDEEGEAAAEGKAGGAAPASQVAKRPSPWTRYRAIVRAVKLFAGGFALLFGARLADGCTSGHGLSGMSQLGVSSFFATGAMFGAGIVCAKVFNYDRSFAAEEEEIAREENQKPQPAA